MYIHVYIYIYIYIYVCICLYAHMCMHISALFSWCFEIWDAYVGSLIQLRDVRVILGTQGRGVGGVSGVSYIEEKSASKLSLQEPRPKSMAQAPNQPQTQMGPCKARCHSIELWMKPGSYLEFHRSLILIRR